MHKLNLQSIGWYLSRPGTYGEFFRQLGRALKKIVSPAESGRSWCAATAIDYEDMIRKVTGNYESTAAKGLVRATNAELLYILAEYLQAERIIETGVAWGKSTRGLLSSLSKRDGRLISTDIPRPDKWVETGIEVPDDLWKYWELIRQPDRKALPAAISKLGTLDLCYYDSDKSYAGRMFGYPLMWAALRKGGILVSDDIGDNKGFQDFCENKTLEPYVTKNHGRYVGVICK